MWSVDHLDGGRRGASGLYVANWVCVGLLGGGGSRPYLEGVERS
jgi:hypothetical protein